MKNTRVSGKDSRVFFYIPGSHGVITVKSRCIKGEIRDHLFYTQELKTYQKRSRRSLHRSCTEIVPKLIKNLHGYTTGDHRILSLSNFSHTSLFFYFSIELIGLRIVPFSFSGIL